MIEEKKIIEKGLPKHLAIILDGNGRWAKKRLLPRTSGHQKGLENLVEIAKICNELGIEALTVYCFSTENWNRPQQEVEFLMNAPIKYFKNNIEKIRKSNIKINLLGRKTKMPKETLEAFQKVMEETKENRGLNLNICFDYGSRYELCEAMQEIAKEVETKKIKAEDITEDLIAKHLYTADFPQLDLLIRTSGEKRISNFLLWQLSYAELYFTDTYWPDFNREELFKAFESYQQRTRRFGAIKEDK